MSQSSDQTMLAAAFDAFRNTEYPGEDADKVFEIYSATNILKPKELSADEMAACIVDSSHDGGIDSFFVFLEGRLIDTDDAVLTVGDPSLKNIAPHPRLEVFVIQSKNSAKWEEAVWEHLLSCLPNLLDANKPDADLEKLYKSRVVERTGIYRRALKSLAPLFPKVSFSVSYVTRAIEANVTVTITAKAEQVKSLLQSTLTTNAVISLEHIGAAKLYERASLEFSLPGELKFRRLIKEPNSFVGVVEIQNYLAFIRDSDGTLRDDLFDSNVRDFEGDNAVNDAIADTLAVEDSGEFWWLNNGITVLSDFVDSPLETLTIRHPLIVNGLQTSHVLDRAARMDVIAPKRFEDGIVVRVIVSADEDVRDRIIAGTNRQTRVPSPALFATQALQRKIEAFLVLNGWFYERRKNRYKNQGKPVKARVSMNFLAQTMITLLLCQPDSARARPSSLFSDQESYERVFPEDLDLNAYLKAVEYMVQIDNFLGSAAAQNVFDDRINARFYVAAGYVILKFRLKSVANLNFDKRFAKLTLPLSGPLLKKSIKILVGSLAAYRIENPKASVDSIFKSAEFRDRYFAGLTGK